MLPHDPAWRAIYEREGVTLRHELEPVLATIHHVGSTAVQGLSAKPIVDLLGEVRDLVSLEAHRGGLEAMGWEWLGEYGIPGRRYLRKELADVAARRAHLHLFAVGDPQVARHLAFRDALRRDPLTAQRYADLKAHLARTCGDDGARYTEGKTAFVESVLAGPLAMAGGTRSEPGTPT